MTKGQFIPAILLFLLSCAVLSCDKIEGDPCEVRDDSSDVLTFKKTFDIKIPGQVIDSRTVMTA